MRPEPAMSRGDWSRTGVTCSKCKRADPVNRSVNIRLTYINTTNFEYERSDKGVQSTTAKAIISIDCMKHTHII